MHNQRRIHYKDNNTFDTIIENIKLALKKDIEIVVRMNTDLYNLEKFIELKDYFKENQFFNYPNFKIYSARLREYDYFTETERKSLKFIPLQKFTAKQINQGIDPLDNNKYYKIYNALKNKRSIPFNPIGCTAQSGGYVLDPIGNIYPCWEVIGKKEFVEGTYSSKGVIWNNKVLNRWHNSDVTQRKPCNHCKYALFCGGGCPYHNFIMNKRENQCSTFKELFNQTVNKAYAELY